MKATIADHLYVIYMSLNPPLAVPWTDTELSTIAGIVEKIS